VYPGPVRWDEFAGECPELAALGEERLSRHQLCLIGTIRRDGRPRISPVEPDFVGGELMLGMMWKSPKALDLIRDPRCAVHSVVANNNGTEGDFKLYGRALAVDDRERRARYCATIKARTGWQPEEPHFHCFAIDVESSGFVIFGDGGYGLAWSPSAGLRRWKNSS